jgi:antitoxin MazE
MKIDLIRIGNSRGIRIPKPIAEQCGFKDRVEMTIRGKSLVISPARGVREGWDAAFAAMAEKGDDRLLDGEPAASEWDKREWRW